MSCLLLVPAGILVFAPLDLTVGIVVGIALTGAAGALLLGLAPTVGVGPDGLRAGRALLPLEHVGTVEVVEGDDARHARGPGLDARAFTCFRAGIPGAVRVANTDPADPAPYWLISSRRPAEFAASVEAAVRRD